MRLPVENVEQNHFWLINFRIFGFFSKRSKEKIGEKQNSAINLQQFRRYGY